jgi:hypothetical protein
MSARADDLFDPAVAAWMAGAAAEIDVDLEVEWVRLVNRLRDEGQEELAHTASPVERAQGARWWPGRDHDRARREYFDEPQNAPRRAAALRMLAVAAVVVALLAFTGPLVVRTSVTIVNFVQEVVETPSTTTTTTVERPSGTSAPQPTTAGTTDLAHAPILDGDQYRLTLRQVHEQLNAAIGFGREDYVQLEGADTLLEGLLGQRTEYDAELRDTIGHLRQAMRAQDRRAASAAHTIIDRIQRETAGG